MFTSTRTALLCSILSVMAFSTASISSPVLKSKTMILFDKGDLTFNATQTSASILGSGFVKFDSSLNNKVDSTGQFNIVGSLSCSNGSGFVGQVVGTLSLTGTGDSVSYQLNINLCPTALQGVYGADGTITITGGTGTYAKVSGQGSMTGLGEFSAGKFNCLASAKVTY